MRRAALGALLCAAASVGTAAGQEAHPAVDLGPYLMDEAYEAELARSAAPAEIGAAAGVLVLRADGYHEVARGTNGFVCLVERSWSSPFGPHEDFFNPRLRAPICYNPGAADAALQEYLSRTRMALAGKGWSEIRDGIGREISTGALRPPRGLAMSYMLSAGQLLGTGVGRYVPHLMFYVPYATEALLGAGGGNPHVVFFEYEGGPFAAINVPLSTWNEAPEERGRR